MATQKQVTQHDTGARKGNVRTESNAKALAGIKRALQIFVKSDGAIRPHLIVSGESGSGKSHTIAAFCDEMKIPMLEINCAQLTKEGTSGNSLSKALSPLIHNGGRLQVVFCDEFDKLFISGNSNSSIAHETTLGVQNEFLKVIEGRSTAVYGDYGKYVDVPVDKVLFIFAGAFNGEQNLTLDRLRTMGMKTEFLGRVGLLFAMNRLTLTDMENVLRNSVLLEEYLKLFPDVPAEKAIGVIMGFITQNYEKNTIGARMITTLIHQYFINGGKLEQEEVKKATFQQTMRLTDDE